MKVTYIDHSCFLVETDRFYYLFDYANGSLPEMDMTKPVYVLFSHGHDDHCDFKILSLLDDVGVQDIRVIASDDMVVPEGVCVLKVTPGRTYEPDSGLKITAFHSTDLGVAFLVEDQQTLIYHAGDLNDWVWEEESPLYNRQMTDKYRKEIKRLSDVLQRREIDVAFVVLDPRQEKDYDKGMMYFLEHIPAKQVYPMHYWGHPEIIHAFLTEHPQFGSRIQKTE